jgi:hypothetical protein
MIFMLLGTNLAHATLFSVEFDFSANLIGTPSGAFSGSGTFEFDDSSITGIGFEFVTGNVTSLTLSPATIGVTTFDTSNSSADLFYEDGSIFIMQVGGSTSGAVTVLPSADDWGVFTDPGLTSINVVEASEASTPALRGQDLSPTGSMTITTIPEPSSLALAVLVSVVFAGVSRQHNASPLRRLVK